MIRPLNTLQALVTGYIAMALDQAARKGPLQIEVEIRTDGHNYLPEVEVHGLISGERILVRVEMLHDPEAQP